MANRLLTSQLEHDTVVRASANTYSELQKKGYKVSINPGSTKNQFVGSELNPCYPDVVVWLPNTIGSTSGRPEIIKEIETAESITDKEAVQWKDYGSRGVKFLLVVPIGYENNAIQVISKNSVKISELWRYYQESGQIKFEKYQ
jgi:hypothetical protein